jgi:hypothetical protein
MPLGNGQATLLSPAGVPVEDDRDRAGSIGGEGARGLVLLQVLLPPFWVASTKPEAALVHSQG